jgi:RNA polymerase sigma factor (sigma-70 family)
VPADIRPEIPDESALALQFEQHAPKLRAMIASRLDPKARARRDASDLLQGVYLKARDRLDDYARSGMTPYAWLYQMALDSIFDDHDYQHRRCRDVGKERAFPEESSACLVPQPVGTDSTPSQHVATEELRKLMHERLNAVLARLDAEDQELIWKHTVDGLTLAEIAQIARIEPATARQRYARARLKLRDTWIELYGEPESRS